MEAGGDGRGRRGVVQRKGRGRRRRGAEEGERMGSPMGCLSAHQRTHGSNTCSVFFFFFFFKTSKITERYNVSTEIYRRNPST